MSEVKECEVCGGDHDEDAHEVVAQREGASTRTADDLAHVFMLDVIGIVGGKEHKPLCLIAGEWGVLLEQRRDPHTGSAWLDPEQGDGEIHDDIALFEGALSDAGHFVVWDDGFVIYGPADTEEGK